MDNSKTNRRGFLTESGKLASAGWLAMNIPLLLAAGHEAADQQANHIGWVNMTPQEAETFAAIADQIIPPDNSPGASEAGVVYFIDNVLGGFMSGASPMLKQGLADLDTASLSAFPDSTGFVSLNFSQQTALLETIEATPFFGSMIFLTNCGMFAMPAWGGNKNRSGWALLGFDDRHAWQPPFGYYDAQADAQEGLNEPG